MPLHLEEHRPEHVRDAVGDPREDRKALEEIARELGEDRVLGPPHAAAHYARNTIGAVRRPAGAVRPRHAADVVAVVRAAARHGVPLYPISRGRNWGYGSALPVRDRCIIVDCSGMDRIREWDPELALVTVEPGVSQALLRAFLDEHAPDYLVPVTGAGPEASILGNALERGYGITPHADHFGAVTALKAVLPDGRVYRSALTELGGEQADRAFKWGLGPYLDGVFTQGSLGIVTEATISLARRPERLEAFLFSVPREADLPGVVDAIRDLVRRAGANLGSVNLMNVPRVLAMMTPYRGSPRPGAGTLPTPLVEDLARRHGLGTWTGFGAIYGERAVVKATRSVVRGALARRVRKLRFVHRRLVSALVRLARRVPFGWAGDGERKGEALLRALDNVAGEPSEVALPLAYRRSRTPPPEGRPLDPARDGCGLIWYSPLVPMRSDLVTRYADMVREVCRLHAVEPLITLTSLSDRCFDSTVPILFDAADEKSLSRARSCYEDLFEAGRSLGLLPYRVPIPWMRRIIRPETPYWDMVSRLKDTLDPQGIISPGRYAP